MAHQGWAEWEDWENAEWEHAAADSQLLMWQAQVAAEVTHVPIGQDPPRADVVPGDADCPRPLDIDFRPRKDQYMVVTRIGAGGPDDAEKTMLVGDILVAVNGMKVRGYPKAEVAALLQYPPPLLLTLAAEFKVGGDYVPCHTLYNGDRVAVKRLESGIRPMEPAESSSTDSSRHDDEEAPLPPSPTPAGPATPSPKPPKSAPRRVLSKVRKVGKAVMSQLPPRGKDKDGCDRTNPLLSQQQVDVGG